MSFDIDDNKLLDRMMELTKDELSVVILESRYDMRFDDIADVWNINTYTVEYMYNSALKKLLFSFMKKECPLNQENIELMKNKIKHVMNWDIKELPFYKDMRYKWQDRW